MKEKREYRNQPGLKKNLQKKKDVIKPDKLKVYIALVIIILIPFIAYIPVFQNNLLDWDDNGYIKNNLLVHLFDLKRIFSQYVMGNYHPITMLTYAIEYRLFGMNAAGYHAINLLLHLLNVTLVFYVVFHLSEKVIVALVASLLFGIHPVHVESVAWAAELKDLLYTLFFLASYIFYLKYLKKKDYESKIGYSQLRTSHQHISTSPHQHISTSTHQHISTSPHQHISTSTHYYLLALLLFLISLLSKAMAASLPLVLILTDYFKGRKISTKTLLEKIPFFLLALIFGVIAVLAQKSTSSIQDTIIPFPERLIFACYGFISYLFKLLFPFNICAFYPYPVKNGEVYIPGYYYLFLLAVVILAVYVIYSRRFSKKIIFSMGFFTLTILLVLQLLPVGKAVMADRYSYIPSIGIFYLAGEGFLLLWSRKKNLLSLILLGVIALLFSIKTYRTCGAWKNDMTLWSSVIEYDKTIEEAYINRGLYFEREKRNNEAIKDFNSAIEQNPDYERAYSIRGIFFMNQKRNEDALKDFNKAVELKPGYASAYINRGNFFMSEKRNTDAINDFNMAIRLKPGYSEPYNNRGIILFSEKRILEALTDFNKAIQLSHDNAESFFNRGLVFVSEKRNAEAINDFNYAIELKPDYVNAYLNRGIVFFNEKRNAEAMKDFNQVIELNPGLPTAYNYRGNLFASENRNEDAIKNYNKAIALKPDYLSAYFNRGNILIEQKRYEEAVNNFTQLLAISPDNALAYYKRGIAAFYSGKKDAACTDLKIASGMGYRPAEDALSQMGK